MSQSSPDTWVLNAIGTQWQIDADIPLTDAQKQQITDDIVAYDRVFSRFVEGSLIDRIFHTPGTYRFPPYADELFALYNSLYELTDGVFTPLVGQILDDLGYDAAYVLKQKQIPVVPHRWPNVASYKDQALTTQIPLLLDVGAAGKGHIVDLVARRIHEFGATYCVVDAGSDMCIRRPADRPLRIGLEHPNDIKQVIGVLEMCDRSLCGSSVNRRTWGGGLHHIINPHTAAPSEGIIASWVLADSTMLADALATALFLVEPTVLLKKYRFDYTRINDRLQIDATGPFREALF